MPVSWLTLAAVVMRKVGKRGRQVMRRRALGTTCAQAAADPDSWCTIGRRGWAAERRGLRHARQAAEMLPAERDAILGRL